jgi:hypothetical protein
MMQLVVAFIRRVLAERATTKVETCQPVVPSLKHTFSERGFVTCLRGGELQLGSDVGRRTPDPCVQTT